MSTLPILIRVLPAAEQLTPRPHKRIVVIAVAQTTTFQFPLMRLKIVLAAIFPS
jgi:hypothetical protein